MKLRTEHHNSKASGKQKQIAYGIGMVLVVLLFVMGLKIFSADTENKIHPQQPVQLASAGIEKRSDTDGLWDGPILYHQANSEPINLILVEKATQQLHLYRYDGRYQQIKSYTCGTGEKRGNKKRENDEKTPEGIYFNVKAYRDSKVTIFGDRAFGLNYPDAFDVLDGNKGSGIFIHGSNKTVTPFSTNGCVVLNNRDLAELDKRIQFKNTPVIIGDHLPYRFTSASRSVSELIPLFKKAMIPKSYAHLKTDFHSLTVLGFKERVVAMGEVRIEEAGKIQGLSRLYLGRPDKNLLVLLKREWNEKKPATAIAKAAPRPSKQDKPPIASLVESWRKAWEGKQLNTYIAHYHPAFKSSGKNLAAWKRYKDRLNKQYRKISVEVSDLKVKVNSQKAYAYFKQRYRGDSLDSSRYKRLEFRKKGTSWKIYRERSYRWKQADWPT